MVPRTSYAPALAAARTILAGLLVLAGVAGGAGAGSATAASRGPRPAAATHPDSEGSALEVTLESLTPSTVPRRGPVVVTGTITNVDDATWTDIDVYPLVSAAPMTSRTELADAAETDVEAVVGSRILVEGTYDTVDRLDPGASQRFTVRVPAELLGVGAPGVYWFGVHALGTDAAGRDDVADGRGRTFLPLLTERVRTPLPTAIVLPVRHRVVHRPDGSLADPTTWARALRPGGVLRALVDLGRSADAGSLTWLVDPAVVDAVRKVAAGNPPRSLAPTIDPEEPGGEGSPGGSDPASGTPDDGGSPSGSDGASGDDGEGDDQGGDAGAPELSEAAAAAAEDARAWLDDLQEVLREGQVLALPYGDVDVAAAAEHDPGLYRRARERSTALFAEWGVEAEPAVAPPSGHLDEAGLLLAETEATIVVADSMFRGTAPPVATAAGHRLTVSSAGATAGGPGPGHPHDHVALRQRILAEAAVRLLEPNRPPLVVMAPTAWEARGTSGFFGGLDVDWLDLATADDVSSSRGGREVDPGRLRYPAEEADRELDAASFVSAEALVDAGSTLQNVLTLNDRVSETVRDEALASTSYYARAHPDATRIGVDRARAAIEGQLASIEVSAPPGVNLSSATGKFAAALRNGIDQPVTVAIEAVTDESLEIRGPREVEIPAGGSRTVLLSASASRVGVHQVTLVLTDVDGTHLGSTDALPIRSIQVSEVIWLIMGTGAALLLLAVVVRLVRRVRRARAGHATADEPAVGT